MKGPKRVALGENFPRLKGKVVESVRIDDAEEMDKGGAFIKIHFKDGTELSFWMTARVVVEQAELGDWRSGNFVPLRLFMASPEIEAIRSQDKEFNKICRRLDREKKRKAKSNRKRITKRTIEWMHDNFDYIVTPREAKKFVGRLPVALAQLRELVEE